MRPSYFSLLLICALTSFQAYAQQDFSVYCKEVKFNCNQYSVDRELLPLSATAKDGAVLSGEFKGSDPAKIKAVIQMSWGQITEEYCYSKGIPVYVFVTEEKALPDPGGSGKKLMTNFTSGFYFLKYQLVYVDNILGSRNPTGKKEALAPMMQRAVEYADLLKEQLESGK